MIHSLVCPMTYLNKCKVVVVCLLSSVSSVSRQHPRLRQQQQTTTDALSYDCQLLHQSASKIFLSSFGLLWTNENKCEIIFVSCESGDWIFFHFLILGLFALLLSLKEIVNISNHKQSALSGPRARLSHISTWSPQKAFKDSERA